MILAKGLNVKWSQGHFSLWLVGYQVTKLLKALVSLDRNV